MPELFRKIGSFIADSDNGGWPELLIFLVFIVISVVSSIIKKFREGKDYYTAPKKEAKKEDGWQVVGDAQQYKKHNLAQQEQQKRYKPIERPQQSTSASAARASTLPYAKYAQGQTPARKAAPASGQHGSIKQRVPGPREVSLGPQKASDQKRISDHQRSSSQASQSTGNSWIERQKQQAQAKLLERQRLIELKRARIEKARREKQKRAQMLRAQKIQKQHAASRQKSEGIKRAAIPDEQPSIPSDVAGAVRSLKSPQNLRAAIVFSEILGPPKALSENKVDPFSF